jgi:hypothetical protein
MFFHYNKQNESFSSNFLTLASTSPLNLAVKSEDTHMLFSTRPKLFNSSANKTKQNKQTNKTKQNKTKRTNKPFNQGFARKLSQQCLQHSQKRIQTRIHNVENSSLG